jgi:hypothetical protein
VAFLVHRCNGFDIGKGGAEYALTQLLLAVALLLTGPGLLLAVVLASCPADGNSEPRIRLFDERPMTRTESGTFSFFGYAHGGTWAAQVLLSDRCSAVAAIAGSRLRITLASPKSRILVPPFGHEDVRRFDVTMDNALGVCSIQCIGDLDADFQESLQFQRLTCDCILQGLAIEELHSDEGAAFVFANFTNGANVRMVQSRSGTRFPSKTFQCLRTTGQPLRQKLQGGEAAQCGVLGLVDDPHPPPSSLRLVLSAVF